MIEFIRRFLLRLLTRRPKPNVRELQAENAFMKQAVSASLRQSNDDFYKRQHMERVSELVEARQMAGSGPWRVGEDVIRETDALIGAALERLDPTTPRSGGVRMRETAPIVAQGATGDIALALENVQWSREINLSWMEFSRWGVQQIILISRLGFVKNPLLQRGVTVVSNYVFGRGCEVMSEDDDANKVLQEFFERNKSILGQTALADLHKRLQYDGQVFYVFFADKVNTGKTNVRTIDATEIFEIITAKDDTDEPHFYHRKWTQKAFEIKTGLVTVTSEEAYYPALGWTPTDGERAIKAINGKPIMWDTPVLMQKGGVGVSKWHFDVPRCYAALDWARNARRLLEVDLDTRMALSQIVFTLKTKGGQQALEGGKTQLGTTVGPTSPLWDMNPPATSSSTFASGPGTTLEAFDTRGAVRNPSDVKEYRAMVAITFEIPPTFLGDLETANLATATSLDRPTELAMLEKQERWRDTLATIAKYILSVDQGAASGNLREANKERRTIVHPPTKLRMVLGSMMRVYEAKKVAGQIVVKVNFPAIREGDMPTNVKAIVEAMTLENKGGQIVGIDEKEGCKLLYQELGVEDYGEILDEQYPEDYDPDRTKEPLPAPIGKAEPDPGGEPQLPGGKDPAPIDKKVKELRRAVRAVLRG